MRKTGHLPLITPFMKNVQNQNNQAINEALNEMFLESEDHEALWESVTNYENIDQLSLAQQTERHQFLEFRRISAYLYRRNKEYAKSIALSKQDKQYRVIHHFLLSAFLTGSLGCCRSFSRKWKW